MNQDAPEPWKTGFIVLPSLLANPVLIMGRAESVVSTCLQWYDRRMRIDGSCLFYWL